MALLLERKVPSAKKVSSNTSRLGLKGSEDLGDGLSAIWQIEQQVNIDDTTCAGGTGTLATRNSFGGLKSDSMGTVLLGRHDTPYKIATRKLDVFADNLADSRALTGGVAGKSAALHLMATKPTSWLTPARQ